MRPYTPTERKYFNEFKDSFAETDIDRINITMSAKAERMLIFFMDRRRKQLGEAYDTVATLLREGKISLEDYNLLREKLKI